MAQFYNLKIKDIYKETDDCSVLTIDVPDALKNEF